MSRNYYVWITMSLFLIVCIGCTKIIIVTPTPEPTATLAPTSAPAATLTPSSTPTHISSTTQAPTATPTSTRVPTASPAPTLVPTATSAPVRTSTLVPIATPMPTSVPTPTPTIVLDVDGLKTALYSEIHEVRDYFIDEVYFDDRANTLTRESLHIKYCPELIYEGQICFPPFSSPYWGELRDTESYLKNIYWPVNRLIVNERVDNVSQEYADKMANTMTYKHDSDYNLVDVCGCSEMINVLNLSELNTTDVSLIAKIAIDDWIESSPHKEGLLDPFINSFGIGVSLSKNGHDIYFVLRGHWDDSLNRTFEWNK